MTTLYKVVTDRIFYWETWNNEGKDWIIHFGKVGERGHSEKVKNSLFSSAERKVKQLIAEKKREDFIEVSVEDHDILIIEYKVDGHGSVEDLNKRHELEDFMNDKLGWVGLGHCDGGSIGSGTMEICCFVINFEKSLPFIEKTLQNTAFSDYIRIYKEN